MVEWCTSKSRKATAAMMTGRSRMLRYGVTEVRRTSSAAGSTVSSRCAPKRSALVSCAEVLATGWTMADVMCQDGGTSRRWTAQADEMSVWLEFVGARAGRCARALECTAGGRSRKVPEMAASTKHEGRKRRRGQGGAGAKQGEMRRDAMRSASPTSQPPTDCVARRTDLRHRTPRPAWKFHANSARPPARSPVRPLVGTVDALPLH
ncbi:hypothetical protein L1887_58869 [Cichorium endivia]|nr:hypothetical protein L1887_58869 [Cichorium endivia]